MLLGTVPSPGSQGLCRAVGWMGLTHPVLNNRGDIFISQFTVGFEKTRRNLGKTKVLPRNL